jgi:hypothetical protein
MVIICKVNYYYLKIRESLIKGYTSLGNEFATSAATVAKIAKPIRPAKRRPF